jgi:hypothetical protein
MTLKPFIAFTALLLLGTQIIAMEDEKQNHHIYKSQSVQFSYHEEENLDKMSNEELQKLLERTALIKQITENRKQTEQNKLESKLSMLVLKEKEDEISSKEKQYQFKNKEIELKLKERESEVNIKLRSGAQKEEFALFDQQLKTTSEWLLKQEEIKRMKIENANAQLKYLENGYKKSKNTYTRIGGLLFDANLGVDPQNVVREQNEEQRVQLGIIQNRYQEITNWVQNRYPAIENINENN